jgi:hypothetical protein
MKILEKIDNYLGEETAYQKFFNKKMKEAGFKSPADMSDEEKKEFFNMIDKEWKGEKE